MQLTPQRMHSTSAVLILDRCGSHEEFVFVRLQPIQRPAPTRYRGSSSSAVVDPETYERTIFNVQVLDNGSAACFRPFLLSPAVAHGLLGFDRFRTGKALAPGASE